jgi:hypothetical protein
MIHSLIVAGGNAGGWWLVYLAGFGVFLQLQSSDISTVLLGAWLT